MIQLWTPRNPLELRDCSGEWQAPGLQKLIHPMTPGSRLSNSRAVYSPWYSPRLLRAGLAFSNHCLTYAKALLTAFFGLSVSSFPYSCPLGLSLMGPWTVEVSLPDSRLFPVPRLSEHLSFKQWVPFEVGTHPLPSESYGFKMRVFPTAVPPNCQRNQFLTQTCNWIWGFWGLGACLEGSLPVSLE